MLKKLLKDRNKTQDLCFAALLLGAFIFSLWKCRFGYIFNDEPFYLTIPQRLMSGDMFIRDEWHLSQLSGFLNLPFFAIYKAIVGSVDGIILAARYYYVAVHTAAAIITYLCLRRSGPFSVPAVIFFYIYTPLDIMACSYNTLALDLLAVSGALIYASQGERPVMMALSGLAFAGAVLCCPYLAVVYIIYIAAVIASAVCRRKGRSIAALDMPLFAGRSLLGFTVGIALLALAFLAFFFSRAGISDIVNNLTPLFSDPEHISRSIFTQVIRYFYSAHYAKVLVIVILYFAMLGYMIYDKKRVEHRLWYLTASLILSVVCFIIYSPICVSTYYNAIMFPVIFPGFTCYVLSKDRPKLLFAALFIPGVIYSFAIFNTSNQGYNVTTMALSVANIASFIFIGNMLRELGEESSNAEPQISAILRASVCILMVTAVIFQFALEIKVKANHCFWESVSPSEMTTELTDGIGKGIRTTQDHAARYNAVCEDLSYYDDLPRGNILMLTYETWNYLAVDDYPFATYSVWLTGQGQLSVERLYSIASRQETYYELNPDKLPRYVYISRSMVDFTDQFDFAGNLTNHGYTLDETTDISYKFSLHEPISDSAIASASDLPIAG